MSWSRGRFWDREGSSIAGQALYRQAERAWQADADHAGDCRDPVARVKQERGGGALETRCQEGDRPRKVFGLIGETGEITVVVGVGASLVCGNEFWRSFGQRVDQAIPLGRKVGEVAGKLTAVPPVIHERLRERGDITGPEQGDAQAKVYVIEKPEIRINAPGEFQGGSLSH